MRGGETNKKREFPFFFFFQILWGEGGGGRMISLVWENGENHVYEAVEQLSQL
jgi:hypothetical protein